MNETVEQARKHFNVTLHLGEIQPNNRNRRTTWIRLHKQTKILNKHLTSETKHPNRNKTNNKN